MTRPTFIPEFEEDESDIRDRVLSNIDDSWRKERGDFMYDAVAATPLEVKQLEANQDEILKHAFPQYAEGEWLDLILQAEGMIRNQATPCKRNLSIVATVGVNILAGQKLSVVITDNNSNPIEFTADSTVTFADSNPRTIPITCRTPGIIGNVPTGSQFIFSPPLAGITSIVDTGAVTKGTDKESDEDAWNRYLEKKSKPSTGGNKADYERWAKEITGVGKSRCIPRWNGNGTVKVIIADIDLAPASPALVTAVQNYIDPGSTGLGEGKAPCGAQVTVVAANQVTVAVTATVTYLEGHNPTEVKAAFTASLLAYLKTLAFINNSKVVYNKVAAYLMSTEGVDNYANLKVNDDTVDIAVGNVAVAAIGTVTI